jgi:hypothetical protein
MVPACSFALSLSALRARSAFLLHRLNRLAPIPAASLLHARCAFTGQLTQLLSLSPLPSRSFCSLGIKAFNRRCRCPVRLPNSPDLRSLPAALSIASVGFGSSVPAGTVTGSRGRVVSAPRSQTPPHSGERGSPLEGESRRGREKRRGRKGDVAWEPRSTDAAR